jgi:uncharacterized protein
MVGARQALSTEDVRRRLRGFCEKHRIRRLEVFGSVARGEGTPDSDLDLLVTLDESAPVSTDELLEMAGEAEELVAAPVDFVLRRSLEESSRRTGTPASRFTTRPSASMHVPQISLLSKLGFGSWFAPSMDRTANADLPL